MARSIITSLFEARGEEHAYESCGGACNGTQLPVQSSSARLSRGQVPSQLTGLLVTSWPSVVDRATRVIAGQERRKEIRFPHSVPHLQHIGVFLQIQSQDGSRVSPGHREQEFVDEIDMTLVFYLSFITLTFVSLVPCLSVLFLSWNHPENMPRRDAGNGPL